MAEVAPGMGLEYLGEVGVYTPWVANEHPTTASGAQIENRNLGCCSLTERREKELSNMKNKISE